MTVHWPRMCGTRCHLELFAILFFPNCQHFSRAFLFFFSDIVIDKARAAFTANAQHSDECLSRSQQTPTDFVSSGLSLKSKILNFTKNLASRQPIGVDACYCRTGKRFITAERTKDNLPGNLRIPTRYPQVAIVCHCF